MIESDTDIEIVSFGATGERRGKRRFRIEREARYKLLYGQHIAETGVARTLNISSSGVWFTTEGALPMGVPIELSISWPALLNDYCPMKLMIFGCVIRSTDEGAAINIERYEFRTQGSTLFQTHSVDPREYQVSN
jgi:hypothetical protein